MALVPMSLVTTPVEAHVRARAQVDCEVERVGEFWEARFTIHNPGGAAGTYELVAVVESGGDLWRSRTLRIEVGPRQSEVRVFRPFERDRAVTGCRAEPVGSAGPPGMTPGPAPADGKDDAPLASAPLTRVPRRLAGERPRAPADQTPPVTGARFGIGMILGSTAGGLGLIGGARAGLGIGSSRCSGWGCFGYAIVGGWAGLALGSAAGVYVVGISGDQTGSLVATLVGTTFGSLVGVPSGIGLASKSPPLGIAVLVGVPTLGGILGFNSTRRYRQGVVASPAGLLHLEEGAFTLGAPVLGAADGLDGRVVPTLNLVGGRF
jgi:hypothetical protein